MQGTKAQQPPHSTPLSHTTQPETQGRQETSENADGRQDRLSAFFQCQRSYHNQTDAMWAIIGGIIGGHDPTWRRVLRSLVFFASLCAESACRGRVAAGRRTSSSGAARYRIENDYFIATKGVRLGSPSQPEVNKLSRMCFSAKCFGWCRVPPAVHRARVRRRHRQPGLAGPRGGSGMPSCRGTWRCICLVALPRFCLPASGLAGDTEPACDCWLTA